MSRFLVGLYLVLAAGLPGTPFQAVTARAEEVLRTVAWGELSRNGELRSGDVSAPDEDSPIEQLKVENRTGRGATFPVLILESPGITQSRYAIRGKVRYQEIEGEGYLEMWNIFPDGGEYFSRTVESSGPLKSLTGQSDWRPFVLPFFINEGEDRPERLVVNIVLPGDGVVALGPLQLVQYASNENPLVEEGQWWGDSSAGFIGGIVGSLIGCLGGLIGWLGSKGRARRFVLGALMAVMIFGVVALVLGSLALFRSQPYAVYYPLLLLGFIATFIPVFVLPKLRKRYLELEFRKMKAMDVT
jgi:hypothetical protein